MTCNAGQFIKFEYQFVRRSRELHMVHTAVDFVILYEVNVC